MNFATDISRFSHQTISLILVASFMVASLCACTAQDPPLLTTTPSAITTTNTSQTPIEPTLTSIPTLPPINRTMLLFNEGRYKRDEICSRIFDYHQAAFGDLTIVIADNLVGQYDMQKLAAKIVDRYSNLYHISPIPMTRPLTVFIISNPSVGECYSKGNLVFTAPEEIDSRTFTQELLGAATGIGEYWVQVGLTSLTLGEYIDRDKLRNWYQNTDDLDMAGLFIGHFLVDWTTDEEREIARMSAASLVQYILEVENTQPEVLIQQMNNSIRTQWLKSLGVHRTVTYPYDGRFVGFDYSQSNQCSLIVQADTMQFCLNRLPQQKYFDEISDAEFLLNQAYYGRKVLVDYVLAEAPSVNHLINPEEMITFNVTELDRLGFTYGNTITINRSSIYFDVLHEVVHTFEWNQGFSDSHEVWLTEGFAEYLGSLLAIYPQTAKRSIFEDLSGLKNDVDTSVAPGTSYWYYLDSEQFEAAQVWYLAQGGKMDNEESIDPRLYTDAVAFATMFRDAHGGSRGVSIGMKYGREGQDGLELSYTQAASFVAWLCETYTMNKVLNVYVNQAEGGLLDAKSYEELKSAWIENLRSKGLGIAIPGMP